MSRLIFAYGTLKDGYSNCHRNAGRRLPGDFVTVERFPLVILGPFYLPWLLETPGEGHHVVGQLFEVDAAALAQMDALEQVDEPGWYERRAILVRSRDEGSGPAISAEAYFGCASRLELEDVRVGPIAELTLGHDAEYRVAEARR